MAIFTTCRRAATVRIGIRESGSRILHPTIDEMLPTRCPYGAALFEYGVSGIHSFIVNHNGTVFEKDIEPVGGKAPAVVTRFDPDASWTRVE